MDLPKYALEYMRKKNVSSRTAARIYGVTVDELHNAANCNGKHACNGGGCRIR